MIKDLAINTLEMDSEIQSRECIDDETVKSYALDIKGGAVFPPITVFHDGTGYWLADGYHRVKAFQHLKKDMVQAEIIDGDRRDAILRSVGANLTNGLRRTNADKKRAVEVLLKDEEWSKWADREIAEKCGVSHPFVGKLRKENTPSGNGFQIDRPTTRNVQRGGTTYKQETRNIGKKENTTQNHEQPSVLMTSIPSGDAGFRVSEALRNLKCIEATDPYRTTALRKVGDWIDRELASCDKPDTDSDDRNSLAIPSQGSDESNCKSSAQIT